MRTASLAALASLSLMIGCGAPTAPSETGLNGIVERGPVQPVCQIGAACDAPFAATFAVREGSREVATFRSDSQGQFKVQLPPGGYSVVPSTDAPIISPQAQVKDVVVGSTGFTTVLLHFDTGIR
jgi:hypothetical protein